MDGQGSLQLPQNAIKTPAAREGNQRIVADFFIADPRK
jgi:hypothetical protein